MPLWKFVILLAVAAAAGILVYVGRRPGAIDIPEQSQMIDRRL